MQSWNELVQVNGSFYCNLMSSTAELDDDDDDQPDSGSAADWLANGHDVDEPIYLNTLGRTIVRVGDDVTTTTEEEVVDAGQTGETTTSIVPISSQQQQHQHTIKLVIGEPLSLDTSEYVSWDGGSQVGNDQSSPSTDGGSVLDEDCDSISSPSADSSSLSTPSKPQLPCPQPIHSDRVYNDELTHSCCRFFAERQLRHLSIANTTATTTDRQTETHSSGLEDKMQTLRREIVSLVNQDDALFRQLLALNTSIRQLRSQSLQRRVRTLPGSGGGSSNSNGRTRNQLCPSPSSASLTSMTSMSDDGEDDQEEDDEDDGEEEEEEEEGHSSAANVAALLAQSENKKSMPKAGPVLPTANHPAITASQQQQLTRKRISYPPNGRNRSNSQLSRCSFNSSSSTSSSSSSASTTGGSPASTWSATGIEAPSVTMVKAASRTPRSPHSSFYTRVSVKTHQQQLQQQKQQQSKLLLAVDHQLQLQQQQKQQQQSNNDLQPSMVGVHKRQGSYDSGCQGSEPSDAEVFV